jgi:hypothetical protein
MDGIEDFFSSWHFANTGPLVRQRCHRTQYGCKHRPMARQERALWFAIFQSARIRQRMIGAATEVDACLMMPSRREEVRRHWCVILTPFNAPTIRDVRAAEPIRGSQCPLSAAGTTCARGRGNDDSRNVASNEGCFDGASRNDIFQGMLRESTVKPIEPFSGRWVLYILRPS